MELDGALLQMLSVQSVPWSLFLSVCSYQRKKCVCKEHVYVGSSDHAYSKHVDLLDN